MTTSTVASPTSRLRLGHARVDVTPPVGIYHRMCGVARHDRATGVHRPLIADVLPIPNAHARAAKMEPVLKKLSGFQGVAVRGLHHVSIGRDKMELEVFFLVKCE